MTTTLDLDAEVTSFAAFVRRELADLGPDIVDDLTDGLEADLTEKLGEGETLGDSGAYAQELRAAAGLAPRTMRKHGLDDAARAALADIRDAATQLAKLHPWVGGIAAFATSLRPVWWVLRAWILFCVFDLTWVWRGIPSTSLGWVALVGLIVVSVQWGRGKWLPWRWSNIGVTITTVFALLALPFVVGMISTQVASDLNSASDYISDGVLLDGQQVTNIFAYGPDGKPLSDVQLFDQSGRPLDVYSPEWGNFTYDETLGYDDALVPSDAVSTDSGWNVFPLQSVRTDALNEDGTVPSWATRITPNAPFDAIQPMLGYTPPQEPAN